MKITGRQLTVICVAVCVAAVLTPRAVSAATGSSVNITDPVSSSSKARVISNRLLVGDGSGLLSVDGTVKVANGSAPLVVAARPVAHPAAWNQINDISVSSSTPRAVLYSGVGPGRLNLTTFTVAAEGGTAGTVRLFAIVYVSDSTAGDCLTLTGASFGAAERFVLTVPVGETVSVNYPSALVYSAYASTGKRFCVDVEGSGPTGYTAHVSASGFLT